MVEESLAIERADRYVPSRRGFLVGGALLAAVTMMPMLTPKRAFAELPSGISLTLPESINFKIRADGTLVGPSSEALRIVNGTNGTELRITAMKATAGSGVTFVSDTSTAQATNALQISLGPASDKIDLSTATGASGAAVSDELAWTMAAPDMNEGLSSIQLEASGSIANFDADALRTQKSAGTINWYLANDTLTDEIISRTETFENTNQEISTEVQDLYALLTATNSIPREVYVQAPVNNTITVETTPAVWFNTENGQIYWVLDD